MSCAAALNAQSRIKTDQSVLDIVERMKLAVESVSVSNIEVTRDDIKAFGRSGALQLLPNLHNPSRRLTFSLWLVLEEIIFHNHQINLSDHELIRTIENLYIQITDFYGEDFNLIQIIKRAKQPKHALQNKKTLIKMLKIYSQLLSIILDEEVNLLTREGVFHYFSVPSRDAFKSRIAELDTKNLELHELIKDIVREDERTGSVVRRELYARYFDNAERASIESHNYNLIEKGPTKNEAINLVRKLHLGEEDEASILNDIELVHYFYEVDIDRAHAWRAHIVYILNIIKAYELVYGKFVRSSNDLNNNIERIYYSIKGRVENAEVVRAITEERLNSYVLESEEIDFRIQSMEAEAKRLQDERPSYNAELILIVERLEALRVMDFDADLVAIRQELAILDLEIDELKEKIFKEVRNENIDSFADLNNRWQRLLPERAYSLDGFDYSSVSFSADVINYFSRSLVFGSRFLAALSKRTYVDMKRASGLRILTSIHKDFRDIKLITREGKVRIVGKLINGRIHFFHIYASDKPYNTPAMTGLINAYEPYND